MTLLKIKMRQPCNKAWNLLTEIINEPDCPSFMKSTASYWCSNLLYAKDNAHPAIRQFLFTTAKGDKNVKFDDKTQLWEQATNELRGLESTYFGEKLSERPYAERKLIFSVSNIFELSTISKDNVMPVELDTLLANPNIKFPLGHPQINQLYIAHPYNPYVYLLYDNYEIEMLQDKLREFSEIAQALGATEIDVKVVSGLSQKVETHTSTSQGGMVDSWAAGMSSDYSSNQYKDEELSMAHMFNRHQTFMPKSQIAEPKDTIWLQGEPSWQRLIEQRMTGGLTYHKEVIETRSSRVVTATELQNLKAEIQTLFLDLGLEWNNSVESRYSEHKNLVLSVEVKFTDSPTIQSAVSVTSETLSPNELEYKTEFEACIEDGEISARERRLLDRLAYNLNLSTDRVQEIEAMIVTPLTDQENEYLDEFRMCIAEDPKLNSSTRRLLKRLAASLGLTDEQVNKLEKMD